MSATVTTDDIKDAFLAAFHDPQFMKKHLPVWQGMNTFIHYRIDFHEVLDNLPVEHPFGQLWSAFCDLDTAMADVHETRKTAGRNGPKYDHWVVAAEQCLDEARLAFEKVCIDLRTCLTLGLAV
ncbi:MAG: hypothetical protein ACYCS8_04810 [Acidithiobacillus sp.]